MSIRIQLEFDETPHRENLPAGHDMNIVRLMARARFLTEDGWTPCQRLIVDTGISLSLIPRYVWQRIKAKPLDAPPLKMQIAGLFVTAQLAEVECHIVDGEQISPLLVMPAYLCNTDKLPLLLGMENINPGVNLHCDYSHNDACLEFP